MPFQPVAAFCGIQSPTHATDQGSSWEANSTSAIEENNACMLWNPKFLAPPSPCPSIICIDNQLQYYHPVYTYVFQLVCSAPCTLTLYVFLSLPYPWPYVTCALLISSSLILLTLFCEEWVGYLSRYSNWLWGGRSGIECRWGMRFSAHAKWPWGPPSPASCKMGTRSFPGVKCSRGLLLTNHHLLVLRSWKSRAISLPTLWPTPGL